MRIALVPFGSTVNTVYRSLAPLAALSARGHEVRRLDVREPRGWDEALRWCDVLHVHRLCDEQILDRVRAAKALGAAAIWDDDDDVTRVPKGTPAYRDGGGFKGTRRLLLRSKLFASVDLVTTTNEPLADAFRAGGAAEVRVIENYVFDDLVAGRSGERGGALRIGWVAGDEHRVDLERVPVRAALQRLLEEHPQVRVTAIGVDLGLRGERYEHVPTVPFPELLRHVARFDVGLAPIAADLAINRTRSSIKLKEYAAVGVPWLASPIGPYAGLGEREGGRLVPDGAWHAALDALVRGERARRRLAKRAAKWGRSQLLSANVERWERALERAVERAREPSRAAVCA